MESQQHNFNGSGLMQSIIGMAAACGVDLSNWKPGDGHVTLCSTSTVPPPKQESPEEYGQRLQDYFATHGCNAKYDQTIISWLTSAKYKKNPKGFFLHGIPGSGKTRRMGAIAAWFGIECIDTKRMVEHIKTAKNENAKRGYICLPTYKGSVSVRNDLIIDDLGCEYDRNNPFADNFQAVEWVIRERYDAWNDCGCKTYFASNITPNDLFKFYGEKNAGRIWQMCDFIGADSHDFRTQLFS